MAPPAAGAVPPPLPPSVEESYRRKCIQLRQRIHEVEDSNDASRVRLQRLRRGIDKMRLERAFLMEQLAKRTSTNVEDSEGSPSPPPTPKEKPLRTKRGHRKPDFLANLEASSRTSTFLAQPSNAQGGTATGGAAGPTSTQSPSSDNFSTQASAPRNASQPGNTSSPAPAASTSKSSAAAAAPAVSTPPKKPRNAFEMFVNEARSVLLVANRKNIKQGTYDVDVDLARKWQGLGPEGQAPYQERFERGKEYEGYRERVDRDLGKWKSAGDEEGGADDEAAVPTENGGDAEGDVRMAEEGEAEANGGEDEE